MLSPFSEDLWAKSDAIVSIIRLPGTFIIKCFESYYDFVNIR